jgi:hypothetical protein
MTHPATPYSGKQAPHTHARETTDHNHEQTHERVRDSVCERETEESSESGLGSLNDLAERHRAGWFAGYKTPTKHTRAS